MALQPRFEDVAVVRTESLTHEGLAVAHVDGKVVFIQGALSEETVRFRYSHRRRRYDIGVMLEIIEASADRVVPFCPHFGTCGGCSLQHLDPQAQVAAKQRILLENLERIGKVVPERVLPPVTGPLRHYRRRARIGVRLVAKKGGVIVGFRERHSSYIADLSGCEVLDARVSTLLPALRGLVSRLSCPDRIPQIEIAIGDRHVALVFRHLSPMAADDHEILSQFAAGHDLSLYLQPTGPESVWPLYPKTPPPLEYGVDDQVFQFEPTDFVQVNAVINGKLIAGVLDLLAVESGDRVVDFFCGLGNFSLPLARRAAWVVGSEGSPALVSRARSNAQRNGIQNVEFRCEDLYAPTLGGSTEHWWNVGFNKVVLDPPRSGAIELIKTFDQEVVRRILYVSCYPSTLARDAEILTQAKGYRFAAVGILDMFPHTNHVESYALFDRP